MREKRDFLEKRCQLTRGRAIVIISEIYCEEKILRRNPVIKGGTRGWAMLIRPAIRGHLQSWKCKTLKSLLKPDAKRAVPFASTIV